MIIDKILDVDSLYHKFTLEATTMPTHRTKYAMDRLHNLKSFVWSTDDIDVWHKKYYSLEEEKPMEEE